ncbi:HAD-IA family hydrolase [Cryptosporangium sp. NPDC051539]|uniref:HAD-IA family hydrolase n=1 Tax=Cryptosporangium sp. NPDC051539 TaxID=3363962 RepID=UPI003794A6CF
MKAVVFDVDGTLAESERDGHRVAFNDAFARLGLPYHWDAGTYRRLLAITGGRRRIAHYLRERADAADVAVRVHAVKTGIVRAMAAEGRIPLRPGVRPLVAALGAAGIRLFVATTGDRAWVEPLLAAHFPPGTFETVLTGTDVPRLKPEPDVYLAVVERAALDPRQTVAVEDSANGVRAARAAGLPCLAVRNDFNPEDLSDADASVTAFGPDAAHLAGVPLPLPGGRVTPETLATLCATP